MTSSSREDQRRIERKQERQRIPSFFWPILLIGVGVISLLANLGYLPWESWSLLWRLWPLLLIALGIDVLIGGRSLIGAIVSGILISILIGAVILILLFAPDIPALSRFSEGARWKIEHVEYPLQGLDSATVAIDWSSLPGQLGALADSPNLIEGDISYRGDLVFDVEPRGNHVDVELDTVTPGLWAPSWSRYGVDEPSGRSWDVALSPEIPIELSLDIGSGRYAFDLSELLITELAIDGGSGDAELSLPSSRSFEVTIDGGSGSIDIVLPEGAGAEITLDAGSGSLDLDGRWRLVEGERDGDAVWETETFDTADYAVEFDIDQGSGRIRIHP